MAGQKWFRWRGRLNARLLSILGHMAEVKTTKISDTMVKVEEEIVLESVPSKAEESNVQKLTEEEKLRVSGPEEAKRYEEKRKEAAEKDAAKRDSDSSGSRCY